MFGSTKKPKVLVIGGTRGIGKNIVDHFNGDSISRRGTDPGFDIRSAEDRLTIAKHSLNYDLVVNHAYTGSHGVPDATLDDGPADVSQTFMLKALYDEWKEANHKGYLFNSSSDSSMLWRMKPGKDVIYAAMKASQNAVSQFISRDVQEANVRMRYTNIIWGMLDTELSRVKPHYNNGVRGEDVCKVIETLYNLPEDCLIPEFIMEARWIEKEYD